jgi:hypothetical protein
MAGGSERCAEYGAHSPRSDHADAETAAMFHSVDPVRRSGTGHPPVSRPWAGKTYRLW